MTSRSVFASIFPPVITQTTCFPASIVRSGLGSRAKVVGVQAAGADAFTRSWRGPTRVTSDRARTFADGIATRASYDLTFSILKRELDEIVTLEEEEIRDGIRAALRLTHNLAEGAGAASLAAARKYGPKVAGKRVACVMSGGNIDAATLRHVLS